MSGSRAERALDALNLFLSDVRYGLGAYLAAYLLERHAWDEASIGGRVLGHRHGRPAGANAGRGAPGRAAREARAGSRRRGAGHGRLPAHPPAPGFRSVTAEQAVPGAAAVIPPAIAAISLGIVGSVAFARRIGRNEAFNHGGNAASTWWRG